MAKLKTMTERLVRRMCVNYVAYMGQPDMEEEWLEGYFQAKKDMENFLKQMELFEPYDKD